MNITGDIARQESIANNNNKLRDTINKIDGAPTAAAARSTTEWAKGKYLYLVYISCSPVANGYWTLHFFKKNMGYHICLNWL